MIGAFAWALAFFLVASGAALVWDGERKIAMVTQWYDQTLSGCGSYNGTGPRPACVSPAPLMDQPGYVLGASEIAFGLLVLVAGLLIGGVQTWRFARARRAATKTTAWGP